MAHGAWHGATCFACTRAHTLFEVTLSSTPPGLPVLGPGSRTLTYLAGGDCLERLILFHAVCHFKGRVTACLLQQLKEHMDAGSLELASAKVMQDDKLLKVRL